MIIKFKNKFIKFIKRIKNKKQNKIVIINNINISL